MTPIQGNDLDPMIYRCDETIYRYSGAKPRPSCLYPHMCQPGLIVGYYWTRWPVIKP